MRRWIALILAVLGLGTAWGSAPARAAEPYKLGAILAMTGPGAYYGRVMSRGALLAIEEINARGGIPGIKLELVIEDHKSGQPKEGVNAINKLVSIDKVPFILTSYSAPTLAAYPIAAEHKVLMLNGGGWSPDLVGKAYLVNNRMVGSYLGQVITEHAFRNRGARKLAMIYRNDPSGITVRDQVRPVWEKLGGSIVAMEVHELGATDYTAQLAKIKAARPDVVATWSYGKDLGFIIKQAKDIGITVPLVGIDWTPDGQAVAGGAMEGYEYASDYLDLDSKAEWTARFIQDYRKKHGEPPDFYAANYYEGVYVLAELIREIKQKGRDPRSGVQLREALLAKRKFPSVYGGSITFNDDGTSAKPVAIFEVKGGKPTVKRLVE
ncbi:MAG: ABC transporter substrate-binding protein [Candidatus Rokubacteria bacterium]|nr:ABC transporter substrate-binding protein [Candidatus Rokubacteria bacterium]